MFSTYKNKRILITGHTGFKGSWLSLWLKKLGATVLGYSLEPPTKPSLFELLNLSKQIDSVIADIRDDRKLKSIFQEFRPEIVFHLAAQPLVRLSYSEPKLTFETNIIGTINLFEAVKNTSSVKAVVNITSDKCYENLEKDISYTEEDRFGGYDPYSASKGCAELVTSSYRNSFFKSSGVALASARAGNVIGGGDWAMDRLLPDCIRSILEKKPILIRNPNAIRPWQHVLEPLSGYLLLGERLLTDGKKYAEGWNLGPEKNDARTVENIVKMLCEKWGGASFTIDNGDHLHEAHYLKLDCSKAKNKLGWTPKWNIETAIEKLVEWYKCYENGGDIKDICLRQIEEYERSGK